MKKTKIVATIGPASNSVDMLKELFEKGVNVCRINFSHGDHEDHVATLSNIKQARQELDLPIGIMLDTKGPEIRLGRFEKDFIELSRGDIFTLTSREVLGTDSIVQVYYENLGEDVKAGDRILIDDGLVELKVIEVINKTDVKCEALNYGELKDNKGVNIPNVIVNLPALTEKDIGDIKFGIEHDVDFIAASFIRKAEDVLDIREILEENNGGTISIISKIENREGVDNIDSIIKVSDGIMVARGDLGVEIETELMPLVQKDLIKKCSQAGKPVITATQMLDSMMRNPRPTRAEVTDVANAILDGTSSIMLSGETAAGKYPLESVETMSKIAKRTEEALDYAEVLEHNVNYSEINTTNAIGRATCQTARDLGAAAIITATSSGSTSSAISKFRPKTPIIAATTTEQTMRKLSLEWGVYPVMTPDSKTTDEVISNSIKAAMEAKYVEDGDLVILTAGVPVGVAGTTNLIKVETIGTILLRGTAIYQGGTMGRVCIVKNVGDLEEKFEDGDIIVSLGTDREMVSYMERAAAILTEEGGLTSHGAIVGLNLEKPTIVGVKDATSLLKDEEMITVDGNTGQVYKGQASIK